MNIGDIVVIVGSESIPDKFLGMYGRVTDCNDYKAIVELIQRTKWKGALLHTAKLSDIVKVGEGTNQKIN